MVNRSKKNNSTEPLGIWDASLRKDYTEIVSKLGPQVKAKVKKIWGLRNVFYSLIGFLLVEVAVSLAVVTFAIAKASPADRLDPSKLSTLFTKVLTEPLILFGVQFSMYLAWVSFMFFATRFQGLKSFRKDFWLKFRWYDLPLGAGIAWGLIALETFILWVLPVAFPHLDMKGTNNGAFLQSQTGVAFYLIAIGIGGIAGPFFEELYFRGFIMQGFIRYFRKGLRTKPISRFGLRVSASNPSLYAFYVKSKFWMYKHKYLLAIILSSVAFGAMHFQGTQHFGQWLVVILTGLIGVVLAWIAIKTKRLGLGIFVHVFFNTTSLLLPIIFK